MVDRLFNLFILLIFSFCILCVDIVMLQAEPTGPPAGHTISIGKVLPISTPFSRASAIEIRSSAMSVPVSSVIKIRAQVLDQFGIPVVDGTLVHFWAGMGTLTGEIVKTKSGFASTQLTAAVEGPAKILATCGMVQATTSLYFKEDGLENGPLIVEDNFKDGYGLAYVPSGQISPGEGLRLSGNGLFYRFAGLRAVVVKVNFSNLKAAGGIESILNLQQGTGKGRFKTLFDLRRAVSNDNMIWLIRTVDGVREQKRYSISEKEDNLMLTVLSKENHLMVSLKTGEGKTAFAVTIKLENKRLIHKLSLFGNKELAGPQSVLVHSLAVHGY